MSLTTQTLSVYWGTYIIILRNEPTTADTHASWRSGQAAGCSAAAVAQCAPSSQSARLQWASPSVRLRASVRTEHRAAHTPPPTLTDTSSARPQQDARGKERACGTAEHFSGEYRPAFKWWVRALERGLSWAWFHQAARTRTLLEYCDFKSVKPRRFGGG